MYARVTMFQMQPSRRDEAVRITEQEIIPAMKDEQGFKHMYVLGDPTTGDGMVISFWESEADLEAGRAKVGQRFARLGDIIVDVTQPSREWQVTVAGPRG